MAALVSLNGIDEAIKNLDYKAKDSPKLKRVHAIRAHYSNELTPTPLQATDSDTLVSRVWDVAVDDNRLRSRRKNLASLRSSVNLDLKLLFENGKNSDGITIGPSNTFVMSDEAKDQMLTSVAASVRKDGAVSLGQITQALTVIEDLLSHAEKFSKVQDGERESGIRRLKHLMMKISERIDLDMGEGLNRSEKFATSGPEPYKGERHDSDMESLEEAGFENGEGHESGTGWGQALSHQAEAKGCIGLRRKKRDTVWSITPGVRRMWMPRRAGKVLFGTRHSSATGLREHAGTSLWGPGVPFIASEITRWFR